MNDFPIVFLLVSAFCTGVAIGLVWAYWWKTLDQRDYAIDEWEKRRRATGPRVLP